MAIDTNMQTAVDGVRNQAVALVTAMGSSSKEGGASPDARQMVLRKHPTMGRLRQTVGDLARLNQNFGAPAVQIDVCEDAAADGWVIVVARLRKVP